MNDAPDWVEQARRLVTGLGQTLGSAVRDGAAAGEGDGAHPADCRWCPVCQAASVLRGERPEVTDALADVLTAAAAALRGLGEPPPAPAPAAAAEAEAEEEPPAPPVQRIEIA